MTLLVRKPIFASHRQPLLGPGTRKSYIWLSRKVVSQHVSYKNIWCQHILNAVPPKNFMFKFLPHLCKFSMMYKPFLLRILVKVKLNQMWVGLSIILAWTSCSRCGFDQNVELWMYKFRVKSEKGQKNCLFG